MDKLGSGVTTGTFSSKPAMHHDLDEYFYWHIFLAGRWTDSTNMTYERRRRFIKMLMSRKNDIKKVSFYVSSIFVQGLLT